MTTVPGDPASLSACASTVRGVADRVAGLAPPLAEAFGEVADGWPGRTSARTRRRGASMAAAAATTSAGLERMATVLQDHATDLAELQARARWVRERAADAGLALRDGRVVSGQGLTESPDTGGEPASAETAARLQAELDTVRTLHARRRGWVLEVLRESRTELSEVSRALRRG